MTPRAGHPGPAPADRAGLSIGIDAEQIARFDKLAAGEKPWRHVYTPREAAHLAAQARAALAFGFAFCCKEALCKALGEAYAFPEFECFHRPGAAAHELLLAPGLAERHALRRVEVRLIESHVAERGECLVEIRLWRRPGSAGGGAAVCAVPVGAVDERVGVRLESVAVGAVEQERARIEADHFSPGELADLGRRRVQSLAGFLALKRALARLWTEASGREAPLRDFELGHHPSGAPRLIAAPPGFPRETLVSIAHTRAWAYALADLGDAAGA